MITKYWFLAIKQEGKKDINPKYLYLLITASTNITTISGTFEIFLDLKTTSTKYGILFR